MPICQKSTSYCNCNFVLVLNELLIYKPEGLFVKQNGCIVLYFVIAVRWHLTSRINY